MRHLFWVTQAKIPYFCGMFVRKKKNRSGNTSVVVVDKSRGGFRELKTIGVSSDEKSILELCCEGKKWIASHTGERDMFVLHAQQQEEKQVTDYWLSNIEIILLNGTQLILIVADSGLMNKTNLSLLESAGYKYTNVSHLLYP